MRHIRDYFHGPNRNMALWSVLFILAAIAISSCFAISRYRLEAHRHNATMLLEYMESFK